MDAIGGYQGLLILVVVINTFFILIFIAIMCYLRIKKKENQKKLQFDNINTQVNIQSVQNQNLQSDEESILRISFQLEEEKKDQNGNKMQQGRENQKVQKHIKKECDEEDKTPEIYRTKSSKIKKDGQETLYVKRLSLQSSILSVKNNLDYQEDEEDVDVSSSLSNNYMSSFKINQISISNNFTVQSKQSDNIKMRRLQESSSDNFNQIGLSSLSSKFNINVTDQNSSLRKFEQSSQNNLNHKHNRLCHYQFSTKKMNHQQFNEFNINTILSAHHQIKDFMQVYYPKKMSDLNNINLHQIQIQKEQMQKQQSLQDIQAFQLKKIKSQMLQIIKQNCEQRSSIQVNKKMDLNYYDIQSSSSANNRSASLRMNSMAIVQQSKTSIFAKNFKIQTKEEFEKSQALNNDQIKNEQQQNQKQNSFLDAYSKFSSFVLMPSIQNIENVDKQINEKKEENQILQQQINEKQIEKLKQIGQDTQRLIGNINMKTVPEFSVEHTSDSQELYSESEEESDYHSSKDEEAKINKKTQKIQSKQKIENQSIEQIKIYPVIIIQNEDISRKKSLFLSQEIAKENDQIKDQQDQSSISKRRSVSLGDIYQQQLKSIDKLKNKILKDQGSNSSDQEIQQIENFGEKKLQNKSQFSRNSKWSKEKKIQAIKFLKNQYRRLSHQMDSSDFQQFKGPILSRHFSLSNINQITNLNQQNEQIENTQRLQIQLKNNKIENDQKNKSSENKFSLDSESGKTENYFKKQKNSGQFILPTMIINEKKLNFSPENEKVKESKSVEQNLLDKQAQQQIKITQQLRQQIYKKSSYSSQLINMQIRQKLKNQYLNRLNNGDRNGFDYNYI